MAHTAGPAFSPARCGRSNGLERADSFILDPHKWLFTPFDCCALLYRDPQLARATHTQDASYLDVIHTSDGEWNPSDYAYQLTRRARGLPLWFSLAVYGLEAYRQAIEVAPSLAKETAELIKAAPQLELIREPDLGVVLFRRLGWKPEDYDAWAQRLHQDEVAFIPPTKWEGETVGRFAFLPGHQPGTGARGACPHRVMLKSRPGMVEGRGEHDHWTRRDSPTGCRRVIANPAR